VRIALRTSCVLILACALNATAQTQTELADAYKRVLEAGNDPSHLLELYVARQLGVFSLSQQTFIATINEQRTDQQTTSSSSSPGAVSNVEKSGIADLLALAIERGKVTKTKNGSSATLSTTPYAMQTFFGLPDTPANWEKYVALRRIALSGTFSSDAAGTAEFSSFTSGEAKVILLGARSPRDAVFNDRMKRLDPTLLAASARQSDSCSTFLSTSFGKEMLDKPFARIAASLESATKEDIERQLAAIYPTPPVMDLESEAALRMCVSSIANLSGAMQLSSRQLQSMVQAYVTQNPNELSAAVLYTKDATTSDFWTAKILYGFSRPQHLSYNLNAQVDVNRTTSVAAPVAGSSAPTGSRSRIRAVAVESGVTFGRFSNGRGDSTLSLKFLRPHDAGSHPSLTAQGQINVHFNQLLTVPVALVYSSRETDTTKKGLQLNFGITSLLDAFLSNAPHQ
jgi:hypothetical protein